MISKIIFLLIFHSTSIQTTYSKSDQNNFYATTESESFSEESTLLSSLAVNGDNTTVNNNRNYAQDKPFKAPVKTFGMFYWGIGIGFLILFIALWYRAKTKDQEL